MVGLSSSVIPAQDIPECVTFPYHFLDRVNQNKCEHRVSFFQQQVQLIQHLWHNIFCKQVEAKIHYFVNITDTDNINFI